MFGQREVKISHDVTFNEEYSLVKVRYIPIPRKDNDDDAGKKDESPTDDLMPNIEGQMDPIQPPFGELSTSRKRPLSLEYTLEYVEIHVAPRGKFRERKKLNKCQGYLVAMSTTVQFDPCKFE